MTRRIVKLGLVMASAVGALAGIVTPASAAFSDTPDPTWMTNGQVYAIAQSDSTVYIGGKFTSIRACRPGVACPNGTVSVLNVAAIDANTGVAVKTFKPQIEGDGANVYALAVLGGKLFIGGKFTSVNGTPRLNLAAVDLATGALDPGVNAQIGIDTTDRIRGMVASGNRVYAAGYFTTVNGLPRKHLAAFDAAGTLDPAWKPRTSGLARTLVPTCDGG